ncbi:MAG: hypothetical protein H7841_00755 [Magnetospirillum sp. WYHS-4]
MDDFIKAMETRNAPVTQGTKGEFLKESREGAKAAFSATEDDSFSFQDIVNIINPLQHLPVISTLYKEMTGDKVQGAPHALGSILYGGLLGGPIGIATSVANLALEGVTGKDAGEHMMALLKDGDGTEGTDLAEQAFEAPAPGSLKVAAVTREDLPPPPPEMAALAQPTKDGDPIAAWARDALESRDDQTVAMTAAEGEDPVTLWARQEHRIRTAAVKRDTPPTAGRNPDPLAEQMARDPKELAGPTPDPGILAALQLVGRETDSAAAGLRQSQDLGREGRVDRAAEQVAGMLEAMSGLSQYLRAERLAEAAGIRPVLSAQG